MNEKLKANWLALTTFFLFLLVWQLSINLTSVSELLLPSPFRILNTYLEMASSGRLFFHTWVTVVEAVAGFGLGVFIGTVLGYIGAKSKSLESVLSPYIIAAQTTPKLALAPLFLLWFGFGLVSKIVIASLVVFFPIFVNTTVAIKSINPDLLDLMKLLHASRLQVFKELELPSSLPMLFAGFKSGITLAVVGAVVGEFVGANSGLGYLIIFSTGRLDTAAVFVAVIQLAVVSLVFYKVVSVFGSKFLVWHESER